MEELPLVVSGTFDAAYCIGNSLPHLTDFSEVLKFFSDVFSLLLPGGGLIVQTINFDRIFTQGIRRLPSLAGEKATMTRLYKRTDDPQKILFETEITLDQATEDKRITQSVPLLALKKEEIVAMAEETGFICCEVCGSYSGDAYKPGESFLTILSAKRKGYAEITEKGSVLLADFFPVDAEFRIVA